MKINKKTGTLELFQDGMLLDALGKEEACSFIQKTQKEWAENAFIFQKSKWIQITLADILAEIPSLDVLCGLNFQFNDETTCNVEAVTKEESVIRRRLGEHIHPIWDARIHQNFKVEYFHFGRTTNRHLRACLSDEVLDFIQEVSGFKIYINGMEENIYDFFDDEKTIDYSKQQNMY